MAKKLWGGRFKKKIDPLVEEFSKSIGYDCKLARYDVLGSRLHVKILEKAKYLSAQEAGKLEEALESIAESIDKGIFKYDKHSEDIHTNIQNLLQKKAGNLALKLHTARSRNDQVVFATKLYCKNEIFELEKVISGLVEALEKLGTSDKDLIIPGFTHLQHAQPVYLKDYLGAYVEMLKRDIKRLDYISKNLKITLGAGALAGTPISSAEYGISAASVIKEMGLEKFEIAAVANSLDSVSDRDFVIEIVSALSIIATHLSRLSEDLIIWASQEFNFIQIDDAFCTGSSLMPQKKNPDVLELVRGYAGRVYGNLVSVLTMMKGLPLTYNRDMQLDKEPLFNSFEIVSGELKVLTGLIKTLKFNKQRIAEQLKDESLYATDIVYYLVDKGIAFTEAHGIVGKLVRYSLDNDLRIQDMPASLLKKFSEEFEKRDIVKLFDPLESVRSKRSIKRK